MLKAKAFEQNKGSGIYATALKRFATSNLTDFHSRVSNFHRSGSNFHFCWQRTCSMEKVSKRCQLHPLVDPQLMQR
jgi:hypothetical protein